MAGHLFGYEAALAIDAQARPMREARSAIEQAAAHPHMSGEEALVSVESTLERTAASFFDLLRTGELNGHLEASTASKVASLLRFALGSSPLEAYQIEYGKVGTPAVVLDDLAAALTLGIEELTRPIDAIKHQAKTVTVGISRSDETLLDVALSRAVLDAGAPRDRLSYASLRTLEIGGNPGLGDAGVVALAQGCPQLSYLDLRGCTNVTRAGVAALRGKPGFFMRVSRRIK